ERDLELRCYDGVSRLSAEGRMEQTDHDHLTRSVTELGEPEALFRISRGRYLTKLSLGVLLILFGIVGNIWLWTRPGPPMFGPPEHLLLIIPITGGALLLHVYRQRGLCVLIYPTGLLRLRRGEVDSFPWHEIDHIRLKVQRSAAAEIERDDDGQPVSCWLP